MNIDYSLIRTTARTLLTNGLTDVDVLDFYPEDFTYPCVIVGEVVPIAEGQLGTGNIPYADLRLDVDVVSYLAKPAKKTFTGTRGEAYGLIKSVQKVIRDNPNFGHIDGILRAVSGTYTLDEEMPPVIWRMRVVWLIRIMAK